MHELSIALSIVDGVLEEAEQRGGLQIRAVHLRLGPLSGVDRNALLFAYQVACEGTPLEGSQLEIQGSEVVVHCRTCQAENQLCVMDMRCPACGSRDTELLQGNNLEITALELHDSEVRA
jgi:hydrogenase nickel incorporation protein HypA/HybF